MSKDFLVCTYTSQAKQYCDERFFKRFQEIADPKISDVVIVDNSFNDSYFLKLAKMVRPDINLLRVAVSQEPERTLFLRKVCESVNRCRDIFLAGEYKYLLVIESDVIPPDNLLSLFREAISRIPTEYPLYSNWGLLGGLYYQGLHGKLTTKDDSLECLEGSVFSGCTVYKRDLIESTPFRWDINDLRIFPDSFMSFDAREKGYTLFHYNKIKCMHLEDHDGVRGRSKINL